MIKLIPPNCPWCADAMQIEDKEMFVHAVAHPTNDCWLSELMNNRPNRWLAIDAWNTHLEFRSLLTKEDFVNNPVSFIPTPPTLKQLQAEWRAKLKGLSPVIFRDVPSVFTECADALTPFILQQERDMKLILDLVSAYEDVCNGYMDNANSDKLIDHARSRLKEME